MLLTDSVRRNGIYGDPAPPVNEAVAVVLGREDDESARRVVDQFVNADLPVSVAYWSRSKLLDAAARVSWLAPWARALRRRYVITREL